MPLGLSWLRRFVPIVLPVLLSVHIFQPLAAAGSLPVAAGAVGSTTFPSVGLVEDLSQRSAYRKVFRSQDQTRWELSLTPMHTLRAAGDWGEIDHSLIPDTGEFAYRNKEGQFVVKFTERQRGNRVRFEHKGRAITFDVPEDVFGQVPVTAQLQGNVLRYHAENANVAFEYLVGSLGLSKNIWLYKGVTVHQFQFRVTTEGVTPVAQPDGSIWFVFNDAMEEPAFYIPAPFAEDAMGQKGEAHYRLEKVAQGIWLVTLLVDQDWLKSPERGWPVRVDPELLTDSDGGQQTTFRAPHGNGCVNCPLEVKPDNSTKDGRTLIQFDLQHYARPPLCAKIEETVVRREFSGELDSVLL